MLCTHRFWHQPCTVRVLQSAFEAAQKAAAAVAEAAEAASRADRLGDAAALFELAARQVSCLLCVTDDISRTFTSCWQQCHVCIMILLPPMVRVRGGVARMRMPDACDLLVKSGRSRVAYGRRQRLGVTSAAQAGRRAWMTPGLIVTI